MKHEIHKTVTINLSLTLEEFKQIYTLANIGFQHSDQTIKNKNREIIKTLGQIQSSLS